MKKQEFVDKIQLYLKLLPTKEGEDGWQYLELGDIEILNNIRKHINELDKIQEGEVIQLEKICLKVVDKLKAEKN